MLGNFGNRLIFPAPSSSYRPDSYRRHLCWIPWNDTISQSGEDETRGRAGVPCLWFPAPKAASVLLFFHANAEDLGMCFSMLKHMRDQFKVNILAVEYPGYGLLSKMAPTEERICEAALTAFRFLVDVVGVRYQQIVICGRSLGSGPAVSLASKYPVGGLILISPFSSIKGAVRSIAGRFAALGFGDCFQNDRAISNVSCPTLFIHGERDELIPPDHSVRLFKRCRARKLLVAPPQMEHNSNLFGDASFLAVPVIHFFGFPGYYTDNPPRLPASVFEPPDKHRQNKSSGGFGDALETGLWLCHCMARRETHDVDLPWPAEASGGATELNVNASPKGQSDQLLSPGTDKIAGASGAPKRGIDFAEGASESTSASASVHESPEQASSAPLAPPKLASHSADTGEDMEAAFVALSDDGDGPERPRGACKGPLASAGAAAGANAAGDSGSRPGAARCGPPEPLIKDEGTVQRSQQWLLV
eukprot:TRINITY_DN9138_c0_g1_i1.p1 TRINITY_DN9138_c0_g1~~TRINITY_DN9138_c0_g1_i1.p1  ORF type:complete len:536 (-),score=84.55 TRINITY_DN9138_c0_g1_i1:90-1514(-)